MSKTIVTPDVVCEVVKSGNRYNAFSSDGTKYTSEITTGCRKNAYNGGYLLGRFPANTNSGFSWRKYTGEIPSNTPSVSVDPSLLKFLPTTLRFLTLFTLLIR